MAHSTYELRMRENATTYPMSAYRPGEYDIRYTLMPYPDSQKHRPLLEIGEPRMIPRIHIPVVFLVNLFDDAAGVWFGKKYETVYVEPHLAREELIPQRYAIYATPEAYELLGLPVIHHSVHEEIPKDTASYQKLMEKQNYVEERWKYTIEYLFRKYEDGPPELLDRSEEDWDGVETIGSSASEGDKAAGGGTRKGPLKQRKARKIKLF